MRFWWYSTTCLQGRRNRLRQPCELPGRDRIIDDASVALERIRAGRPDRGHLLLGLRGLGKTVLLNRIERLAAEQQYQVALIEAPEEKSLAELLLPKLRGILIKLAARSVRKISRFGVSR